MRYCNRLPAGTLRVRPADLRAEDFIRLLRQQQIVEWVGPNYAHRAGASGPDVDGRMAECGTGDCAVPVGAEAGFASSLSVAIFLDTNRNPVTGVPVTFPSPSLNNASATFEGGSTVVSLLTGADGIARVAAKAKCQASRFFSSTVTDAAGRSAVVLAVIP